jgi:hypothetical protein
MSRNTKWARSSAAMQPSRSKKFCSLIIKNAYIL